MPFDHDDDANNEEEGMLGKLSNTAKINHKEN